MYQFESDLLPFRGKKVYLHSADLFQYHMTIWIYKCKAESKPQDDTHCTMYMCCNRRFHIRTCRQSNQEDEQSAGDQRRDQGRRR